MKAYDFNYIKVSSREELFDLLDEHGESAQILAGGQSLIPMLNLRMANPELLIDITGLSELRGLERSAGVVHIGALTTHAQILHSELVKEYIPLLAQAVPHVAHLAIRNAGTIGGSMALADPAAEYPAVALALNAHVVLRSRGGVRRVSAEDFFQGLYKTERAPNELITGVEFEEPRGEQVFHFAELSRRKGDYAMVGVAINVSMQQGRITDARIAFMAVEDKPVLAKHAASALIGQHLSARGALLSDAENQALMQDLSPWDDLQASGQTKSYLAGVMLGRALFEMATQHD